jgi:hypothetical protein
MRVKLGMRRSGPIPTVTGPVLSEPHAGGEIAVGFSYPAPSCEQTVENSLQARFGEIIRRRRREKGIGVSGRPVERPVTAGRIGAN